jgi:hypothetical protein
MRLRWLALLLVAIALPALAKPRVVRHPGPGAPLPAGTPTFSNEIVRILQQNCQSCHHAGDIAPFPLVAYSDAKPRATLIKFMTQTRQMPPWKAAEACGTFRDQRWLSDAQIATIGKWVEAGAPEGNPADLPAPLTFTSDWYLGEPDLVLSSQEAFTPPPHVDTYRCFSLPTDTIADKWVRAVDTHPGDRGTVHHVLTFIDTTGVSANLDDADPGPGYTCFGGPGFSTTGTLGGWAPGTRPLEMPDGVAFKLPAASRVVMQVHYHPHASEPQPDRTQYGIYYSSDPSPKEMRILPLINDTFTIPPNDSHYKVDAVFPLLTPIPLKLWFIAPHMHLLGKSMTVEVKRPNEPSECLIEIDDWDFNWQGAYRYIQPIDIPIGSRLAATAFYDNSIANPKNPNTPPKAVSWGEATTDEMCLAFLGVTIE